VFDYSRAVVESTFRSEQRIFIDDLTGEGEFNLFDLLSLLGRFWTVRYNWFLS